MKARREAAAERAEQAQRAALAQAKAIFQTEVEKAQRLRELRLALATRNIEKPTL